MALKTSYSVRRVRRAAQINTPGEDHVRLGDKLVTLVEKQLFYSKTATVGNFENEGEQK